MLHLFLHEQFISLKGCFEAALRMRTSPDRSRLGFLGGGCDVGARLTSPVNGDGEFELFLKPIRSFSLSE